MKLLLTSNGLQGKIKDVFSTLLTKNPQDCSAAFITTAAYGEEGDPETWLEKYRQQLRDAGITNIENVDLRNTTGEALEKVLENKDIVYVNGGNTFFLLNYARESGFEAVLQKFLNDGNVYVGVSAGSIICCPTIETAFYTPPDLNTVGLTDFTGFSFVNFLISPHFEQSGKVLLEQEAAKASLPVVVLTDMQAVLVQDGTTEIVGDGEHITLHPHV
ncbi:MAG TPA: Type 1 glutamine amidotransferase-like domain-containing protein [Candidatus Eisenbacteria bacterium]|nr:Type 1 glutamine amidotransferase-like domain-containing protein [Candidatus Eisenbacteria bacterium]